MVWTELTRNQKIICGLIIFTALGHIMYSSGWDSEILGINLGFWFIVNGFGYLILMFLLYFSNQFENNKDLIRYILAGWTVGSIIAWALFHTESERYDTLLDASLINKSVEVMILIFLYLDMQRTSISASSSTPS